MQRPNPIALTLAAGYALTILAANVAILTLGVVPVGLGLVAPAGVYFAGLAFSLRDGLQETGGRRWVLGAILAGAALSALCGLIFPPPPGVDALRLAAASGLAFLLSELADFAVYTPLRRRGWLLAVAASNGAGVVVDSAMFLWLAFGSIDFLVGQVVGKSWMTALTIVLILGWRAWQRKAAAHV